MISRHEYGGSVWVDLEHPDEQEIQQIAKEFSISERLVAELFSPTPASIVANDAGITFLVLHFPTHGTTDGEIHDQEIDVVVGGTFIITVHYEVVESLHHLRKVLETQRLIAPHEKLTSSLLIEIIFAHLYAAVRDHTTHIVNRLMHVEHEMFDGKERLTVRTISNISREFLHIEAALANQENHLNRFLKSISARPDADPITGERAERILAERAHIARLVTTYRAIATELRETNAVLLEARQNEIMKSLTVVTFIMLPLEFITFIFGMHAPGTPLANDPRAFWIIVAMMIGTSGILTLFLARKRWIF